MKGICYIVKFFYLKKFFRFLNNIYRLDKIFFFLYILKLNINYKYLLLVYKIKVYIVFRIKEVYVCIFFFREMLLEVVLLWNILFFRIVWFIFLVVVLLC